MARNFKKSSTDFRRWEWGDYVALSYNWGTWDDAQLIEVDGKSMRITKNLYNFLITIRDKNEMFGSLWMWIDAICINQDDITERNLQVKRMQEIYQQALITIVWIGKKVDDSNLALQLLRDILRLHDKQQGKSTYSRALLDEAWLSKRPQGTWVAFDAFTSRPYWDRLWIIQEIALSANHLTIMLGDSNFSWNILTTAIAHLSAVPLDVLFAQYRRDFRSLNFDFRGMQGLRRLQKLCKLEEKHKDDFPDLTLEEVLGVIRSSHQTDPKDKVYGVLNIIDPRIPPRITVDYRRHIQHIYTDFVRACVRGTGSLDIIRQSRLNPSSSKSWPSWLPDLRCANSDTELTARIPYNACGDTEFQGRYISNSCLSVRGFRVDTVDGLGSADTEEPEQVLFHLEHVNTTPMPVIQPGPAIDTGTSLKVADSHTTDKHPPHFVRVFHDGSNLGADTSQPYETQSFRHMLSSSSTDKIALSRTLVADRDSVGNVAGPSFDCLVNIPLKTHLTPQNATVLTHLFHRRRWCDQELKIGRLSFRHYFPPRPAASQAIPYPPETHAAIERYLDVTGGRRLLVTKTGSIGLAPAAAKKTDIVVILFGCSVPMILREIGPSKYTLIGEAYVHGIMNGEAMARLKNKSIGYKVQSFSLY